MGNCIYCGRPAGFLHKKHRECSDLHDKAATKIPEFFRLALGSHVDPSRFLSMTKEIARGHYISNNELRQLEIAGLKGMIDSAYSDEKLTEEEDERITALCNTFGITANELGDSGLRLAKSQILRQLDQGKFPENVRIDDIPINLQRNEVAVWLYNDVTYYKLRKRTQYVGGSHGVSIRVMKGVYYRVGAFKGEPIQTQYLAEEGHGIFLLTNQNTYFWSPQNVIKIPLKKILSVQPYSDGIQIFRDTTNAVPHIFILDDPLFACDAIARLSQG